jgi:hypothetical protein
VGTRCKKLGKLRNSSFATQRRRLQRRGRHEQQSKRDLPSHHFARCTHHSLPALLGSFPEKNVDEQRATGARLVLRPPAAQLSPPNIASFNPRLDSSVPAISNLNGRCGLQATVLGEVHRFDTDREHPSALVGAELKRVVVLV